MVRARSLFERCLAGFTAALLGYGWGWIWAWSLADPNLDLWAVGAGLGALIGLAAGLTGFYRRHVAAWLMATLGLFLGWVARTALFGDLPGGWGLLLMVIGAAAGLGLARRSTWLRSPPGERTLVIMLYAGFLGGFLIDVALLDRVLGLVQSHTILSQSVWILVCAGLAGIWAYRKNALAR